MTDFEIFGQLGIEEGLSDDEIIEAWNVYSKKSTPNHPDTSILA